jgi:flagellin-like hook-associated protein FlgL
MTRVSDIASYKDGMAEGIQTIQSANAGIKGINGLIEAARGLAQSALAADANKVSFTVKNTIAANDIVTIGGEAFTAVATGATGNQFNIKDTDGTTALSTDEIASSIAALVNSNDETGAYGEGDLKALSSGNRITLQSVSLDKAITSTGVVSSTKITLDSSVTADRAALAKQYEEILQQIDSLAGASGYKGNNLLTKDTLIVNFEGGNISVKGFTAHASDLGVNTTGSAKATLTPTTGTSSYWALASDIKFDIVNMDIGVAKLKSEATKLSAAVNVINTQQDFSTTKMNLLTTGADNLTSADANEEGANMLMLQTRQALSTTALSLSAQASQSVLRLFG